MSVLFLPPPSAASVPDATETVSGKIRIATSAEATTGTNDLTAMTPLKVKSVVDAAVVGGVTYQGTFDTSSPVDLSNAEKGDLYIISVAGTYQGQTWAVGDHLLVNADMGGTVSPSKLDKVDNTDAVTSVAGKVGAVTLVAGDVSGLAAVATSGAYSDLSGTPTLATVATTGAYSDLSGTPTLGTAAAEDVGTAASNVVQLDGSARLPAVDGSQLINLPAANVAALDDIGDVTITGVSDNQALIYDSASSEWVNGSAANTVINQYNATGTAAAVSTQDLHIYRLYGSGGFSLAVSATEAGGLVMINNISNSACTVTGPTFRRNGEGVSGGVTSITVEAGERRSFYLESISLWLEVTATNLDRLADVSLSSPSSGEALVYNGTLSVFENATVSASVAALDDIGDVTITSVSDKQFLKYDSGSSAWINADSELYEAATYNSTTTITAPSEPKTLSISLSSTLSTKTLTLYSAVSDTVGTVINISNYGSVDFVVTTQGSQNIRGLLGTITSFTLQPNQSAILTQVQASVFFLVAYEEQGIGSLADVDVSGAVATNVLKYDGTDWVDGAVAYSEVTGTPTLGTAAAEDVGTSASNVVQLDGSARLPAVDGSQLTNLPSAPVDSVAGKTGVVTLDLNDNTDVSYTAGAGIDNYVLTYDHAASTWGAEPTASGPGPYVATFSPSSSPYNLPAPPAGRIEQVALMTPSLAVTVNLVSASTLGSGFKLHVKNRSTHTITLDPNGTETIDAAATFALSAQYTSVTLVSDGANWHII